MNELKRQIKCSNCSYDLEQTTLVVDGKSYCCSGCVQGGPCICSYRQSPEQAVSSGQDHTPQDQITFEASPISYDPDCPYSSAFAGMVTNVLKEVEITQQAVKHREGPVKDLLDLLQRTARLLQIMTYRLEDQKQAENSTWLSRIQAEAEARDSYEKVKLFVQGLTDPDMVFGYTRALSRLNSVNDLKLVNVNDSDACYQIQTNSKAKFARDVISLPDFKPLRVHSTADDITVQLNQTVGLGESRVGFSEPVPAPQEPAHAESPAKTLPAKPSSLNRTSTGGVLEVGIDGFFNARHYLTKDGEPGPIEMRSWRVEISLEGKLVDESGQLQGLDSAKTNLELLLLGYNNKLLNKVPPYDQIQPTPENIARTLYNQITSAISQEQLRVKGLKVWASPTQYVWYSEPSGNAV